ncbi:hypothetical protein HMPREF0043_01561 [Actinobaculum sp. oral taxon 183 str. F0552]|nr:hypothetical protein HMPREF0043_01561 [Actinobaculum sp. oral taxon 183 str. F0552]
MVRATCGGSGESGRLRAGRVFGPWSRVLGPWNRLLRLRSLRLGGRILRLGESRHGGCPLRPRDGVSALPLGRGRERRRLGFQDPAPRVRQAAGGVQEADEGDGDDDRDHRQHDDEYGKRQQFHVSDEIIPGQGDSFSGAHSFRRTIPSIESTGNRRLPLSARAGTLAPIACTPVADCTPLSRLPCRRVGGAHASLARGAVDARVDRKGLTS